MVPYCGIFLFLIQFHDVWGGLYCGKLFSLFYFFFFGILFLNHIFVFFLLFDFLFELIINNVFQFFIFVLFFILKLSNARTPNNWMPY